VYKKGTDNRVADALSRHPEPPDHLMALSTTHPTWLEQVQEGYTTDDHSLKLLSAIAISPTSVPHYTLLNRIISTKTEFGYGIIHLCSTRSLMHYMLQQWVIIQGF
jgi:hypothetical protein